MEKSKGQIHRAKAYQRAVKALKNYPSKIESVPHHSYIESREMKGLSNLSTCDWVELFSTQLSFPFKTSYIDRAQKHKSLME